MGEMRTLERFFWLISLLCFGCGGRATDDLGGDAGTNNDTSGNGSESNPSTGEGSGMNGSGMNDGINGGTSPPGGACGAVDGVNRGQCVTGEHCFENECYVRYGAPPSGTTPPLMRGLFGSEEGQALTVGADGVVDFLEVGLWSQNLDAEVNLYEAHGGTRTLQRSLVIPVTDIPSYAGIHSDMHPVRVTIEPPLTVKAGEQLEVMFDCPEGRFPDSACVSGIYMSDVDPQSHFISRDYQGIHRDVDWDYMVALYAR